MEKKKRVEISELQKKVADLEAQLAGQKKETARVESEYKAYRAEFEPEFEENSARLRACQDELEAMKNRLMQWESGRKSKAGNIFLEIQCSEKELFPLEIENFIKGILFQKWQEFANSQNPEKSRAFDVCTRLLEENDGFDFEKSSSKPLFDKACADILAGKVSIEGYEFVSQNRHRKFNFKGDSRYPLIQPLSPSDSLHGTKNLISEAKKHFLEPK